MSSPSKVSPSLIKELRNAIPHGGLKIIHEMHSDVMRAKGEEPLTYKSIQAVLMGEWYREDVIDVAIAYMEGLKAIQSQQAKKLKSVLS